MAHTAHKNQQDKKEIFDTQKQIDQKVNTLADLIIKSKHFIAFTGAGISTACGIPDFRSGINTVLKTGPGVWEKQAQKIKDQAKKNQVPMSKAIPSFTHMALVELQKLGYLKYLVSQNIDGLHLRSGFEPTKLAEVHGNRCLQKCKKCKSQYLRDFGVRQAKKALQHQTSRKCQKCGSKLYDSIINFGENLPDYEVNRSFEQGQKADLCLAMGSSLTVTPASDVPKIVGKKGKLVIVNLQKTPLDNIAFMKIHGMCDDVMKKLAAKLQLKVKEFLIERIVKFKINKNKEVQFRGFDARNIPFSFFKEVTVAFNNQKTFKKIRGQPFIISMQKKEQARLKFQFYGYYGQPSYQIVLNKAKEGILKLIYSPKQRSWISNKWDEQQKQLEKHQKLKKQQVKQYFADEQTS